MALAGVIRENFVPVGFWTELRQLTQPQILENWQEFRLSCPGEKILLSKTFKLI